MYSLIIFIIFVLPIALNNYLKRTDIHIFVRIFNIVFSWLVFSVFFEEFREIIWYIYENGSLLTTVQSEVCSYKNYCIGIKAIYLITTFFLSFTLMGIGRGKDISRKLLLKYIKYVWVVLTLDFSNQFYVINPEHGENFAVVLFLMSILSGLIVFVIYKLYKSERILKIFVEKVNE